jgi:MoCo/4Fe-4S cofactor protein with predicted Tat translocation signal
LLDLPPVTMSMTSFPPGPPGPPTRFWRTLDEYADDPAFHEQLVNEFPSQIEMISDPIARRRFLKLMGASLALGGLTACTRQPAETIVPYVRPPDDLTVGDPLFFATAMTVGGVATGLIVKSHEGRPTKIEGNPAHPGSLGASDVFAQAAILGLYDPDRSEALTNRGDIRPWPEFLGAMRAAMAAQQALGGRGLRILTESVGSPTLAAQIRDLLRRFPSAKWHQWDPAGRNNANRGALLAFGRPVDSYYRIDQADVIVALDADFLACGPGSLRYARDFARRRNPDRPDRMNRLYAVEAMPTPTGSRADYRLPLRPSDVEAVAWRIAEGVGAVAIRAVGNGANRLSPAEQKWTDAVIRDLTSRRGTCLVVAGEHQPAVVHAIAHAINERLGNNGRTVVYTEPIEAERVDQVQSLKELVADMDAGRVDVLLIVSGNPVYSAPADLGFADAMNHVTLRVQLSLYDDETSALCHWHVPEAHFLEGWSDARAYDGTASVVQPLIAPLYGGKTAHEFLAAMSDRPERSGYDIVRDFWRAQPTTSGAADFDAAWRRWLHDGVIPDTAFPPLTVRFGGPERPALQEADRGAALSGPLRTPQRLEIAFRNDPSVLDGRFANNGWLQELPKPLTKLTWDNAVFVSAATASRLGVSNQPAATGGEHGQIIGEFVELRFRRRTVQGIAFIVAGHADDCATVYLGYGRTRAGHLGSGPGFNANLIRPSDALWHGDGLEIARTGQRGSLACTQYHHLMDGRDPVHAVTLEAFRKDGAQDDRGIGAPGVSKATLSRGITLYPADHKYDGYKWGMAIDLNTCIGCNACVVGCQAENNIPVVGRDQVLRGREMHWLRVDTYYRGPINQPETYFQPVPCMQCEDAPCEVVCPVGATVHSAEGLNDMVYNRCVGTRYCSNNCPYKVRRFNYFLYQDWTTPSLKLGRNPEVTVRSRGVMEKCTYCVQRITRARIDSENEDRAIRDGDIQTACQQACPADAIVFGNLNDPRSRVARLQAESRNYSLLGELNTRPRTTYLTAVRNVNPELG